jgi:hypothetical protein
MFRVRDVVTIKETGNEGVVQEVNEVDKECKVRYQDPVYPDYFTIGYFSFDELEN